MSFVAPHTAARPAALSAPHGADGDARSVIDRAIDALIALALQRIVRMLEQFAQLMQAWRDGTLPPPPPIRPRAPRAHRPRAPRPNHVPVLQAWFAPRRAESTLPPASWAPPDPWRAPATAPAPASCAAQPDPRPASAPRPIAIARDARAAHTPATHAQRPRPPPIRRFAPHRPAPPFALYVPGTNRSAESRAAPAQPAPLNESPHGPTVPPNRDHLGHLP